MKFNATSLLILAATLLSVVASVVFWYGPRPAATIVQPVKVSHQDKDGLLGAAGQVTAFASLDELEAAAIDGQCRIEPPVDFSGQKLVRVRWEAEGPRFGTLEHRVRMAGSRIAFYIDKPPTDRQTFEMRANTDWFAVPGGAEVTLVTEQRANLAELVVVLAMAAWAGLGLSISRRLGCGRRKRAVVLASPLAIG